MSHLRRPTLQAVADATGFSPSTVSRALRDDPRVTQATRDRIRSSAQRLGFTQNAVASSLRTGTTSSLVGLLIPDVQDPFFAAVVSGVQEAATAENRELIVGFHHNSQEEQDRLVRQMVSHRVQALLVVPAPGPVPAQLVRELKFGITVVSMDRPAPHLKCDSVVADNAGGARLLTTALLQEGHQRFAVVGLGMSIWTQAVRYASVRDTLQQAGVSLHPGALASADQSGLVPSDQLDAMLLQHRPTAVVGLSVMPVIQVIDACQRLGLDIELAAFDGPAIFDLLDARVHCVQQSASELGRAAVRMLLEPRADDFGTRDLILPVGPVVVRGRRRNR